MIISFPKYAENRSNLVCHQTGFLQPQECAPEVTALTPKNHPGRISRRRSRPFAFWKGRGLAFSLPAACWEGQTMPPKKIKWIWIAIPGLRNKEYQPPKGNPL